LFARLNRNRITSKIGKKEIIRPIEKPNLNRESGLTEWRVYIFIERSVIQRSKPE
jgi:hypothetical protein